MASQPFKRAFEVQVRQRGGWREILDRIRNSETVASIAKDYGCSRPWLARQLNHPDRREAYEVAKKEAGEAHAEKATEIADTVPESRDAVAKARLQVETHRWMAGVRDRSQFGEAGPDVNVTVNLQALHVEALQHRIVDAPSCVGPEPERPVLAPPPADDADDDGGGANVQGADR
jgi:hypothetical protein